MFLFICLCCCLIFLLYLLFYTSSSSSFPLTNEILTAKEFNQLEGNKISKDNIKLINKLTKYDDAYSVYNKALIADYYIGDVNMAQKYYIDSLRRIRYDTPSSEKHMIIEKIKNRIKTNVQKEYDEKQDILPNILIIKEMINKAIKNSVKRPIVRPNIQGQARPNIQGQSRPNIQGQARPNIQGQIITINKPIINKPLIDNDIREHITWKIDTQNVHDHMLNEQMLKQYKIIESENTEKYMSFENIKNYFMSKKINTEDLDKAIQLINYIQPKDQKIIKLGNITEEEYLGTLVNRIRNTNNEELLSSLINNMKDCWNNGNPVCVTGRITRYLSSFSHLDKNKDIGNLMTLQVLKNEIFGKAGKIQNEIINKLPDDIKKNYLQSSNSNNKSDNTSDIDTTIKEEIKNMILKEYSSLYPKKLLDDIIKECIDSI